MLLERLTRVASTATPWAAIIMSKLLLNKSVHSIEQLCTHDDSPPHCPLRHPIIYLNYHSASNQSTFKQSNRLVKSNILQKIPFTQQEPNPHD
jgi:hypothetical protein